MALSFSPSIKQLWMNRGILAGLPAGCGATVYSGTQPAAADFITNWGTTYNSSQTAFLWHANGITFTLQTGNLQIAITSFPPSTAPTRNGTAEWCCIWNNAPTGPNLSAGTIANTRFILAPVSVTGGTGVLRFTSLAFDTGTPLTIIDGGFTTT
jgi:hypothetical protein